MRKKCLDKVYELAKKNKKVVFIGSDLGPTTLSNFRKEFPDRFYMEGVTEANIINMAVGLAIEGYIPYVNTIATFITRRCLEQIIVGIALHKLPIKLIGNGGGLVYAPLGPTHLATDDISLLKPIPNMSIVSVSDSDEMSLLMDQSLEYKNPLYIRLGKGYDPIVKYKSSFKIGKIRKATNAKDYSILLISTGIMTKHVLDVSKLLEKHNIKSNVIHCHTVKPLDKTNISKLINNKIKGIFTIEENSTIGGLGSSIEELILEKFNNKRLKFYKFGIKDKFIDKYGTQNQLLTYQGLSPSKITKKILKMLKS